MSDISAIMDIYNLKLVSPITKANAMIAVGRFINDTYSMNISEQIVGELLLTLPVNRQDLTYPDWLPVQLNKENKE
jgi:hypothetical protein